jgi:hypothetical protein
MQARAGQDVDLAAEKVVEILPKPHDVRQRTVGVHLHQQIDIAICAVISTRDGAEHTKVAGPVERRAWPDSIRSWLVHEVAARERVTGP